MLKLLLIAIIALRPVESGARVNYVVDALEKLLSYVSEYHELMNLDALFGLVLEQAHLQSIIINSRNHLSKAYDGDKIELMENVTGKIVKLIKPHVNRSHKNAIFLEKMMLSKIWQRNITFRSNRLDLSFEGNENFSSVDTFKKYVNYLAKSNFLEELSDRCFVKLLETSKPGIDCSISPKCAEYMTDDGHIDPTYGVTHRLLFLQTARSQGCNINATVSEKKLNKYCSYIFWEMVKNAEFGFLSELDDLLLEQVTLCGYEGFAEFLTDDVVEHILNIQTEHGCFTVFSPSDEDGNIGQKRRKREANFIKFGCNDHSTGLGASVLALILRFLLHRSAVQPIHQATVKNTHESQLIRVSNSLLCLASFSWIFRKTYDLEMNHKKGGGGDAVYVKKSGITELLGKIKTLEQEAETKDKKMREFQITKEIEHETYVKKIKTLEAELEVNKKAFEHVEENKDRKHQIEIKKLETELVVKDKFAAMFSADISNLKRELSAKEAENQQLRAQMNRMISQKSNDQNAQNELGKIKQNLAKLQEKHQKVTLELSKFTAVPFFKEVLTAKELLAKFEDKVGKTKITPENIESIEQKRQVYKTDVEKRKARNEKLLENLKSNGILTGDYHDVEIEKLESQILTLHKQNSNDVQTKLKKIYEIAHLTAELSGKFNKDIPDIVSGVVQSVKARECELNGVRNSSFQQNFNNQEKKYRELIKKLDDEKILFESLLRNIPGTNKKKSNNTTGRAEDLLKANEATSCSKAGVMKKSLVDLQKECYALCGKYYGEEIPENLEKAKNVDDKVKRDGPSGWTFDFLDNKSDDEK